MQGRPLYVAAYDVRDPRRLRKALYVLKRYSTGGQKSVFECFLTESARQNLIREAQAVLDERHDSFLILQVDGHRPVHTLGIAVAPQDPPYFYVG